MLGAVIALAIASCERGDDSKPPQSVLAEFDKMFPDASDIQWEWNDHYWIASFRIVNTSGSKAHTAWYTQNGDWIRTETNVPIASIPQIIIKYLITSPDYMTASFVDENVCHIQTPSGDFYRFNMVRNGQRIVVDVNINGLVTFVRYD